MNRHKLINQDSGNTEYYTPSKIIEAARRVMGSIDLDPASSSIANKTVMATKIYTEKDNGLEYAWAGNVWMNHPFGRKQNATWINKLISEYTNGYVNQACCITYASTAEAWYQPLSVFPQCFLSPRTNYRLPDSSIKRGATKGSVVTYLGCLEDKFIREFMRFGAVKVLAYKIRPNYRSVK